MIFKSSGSITLRTHLMKIINHNNSAYLSYKLLKHHWTLNRWYSMLFNVFFSLLSQNSDISSIGMPIKIILKFWKTLNFGDHWKTLNFIQCFKCTLKTSFNGTFWTDIESVQFFKFLEAVLATFNFIVKNNSMLHPCGWKI